MAEWAPPRCIARLCLAACLAAWLPGARLAAAEAEPTVAATVGRESVYVEEALEALDDSRVSQNAPAETLPKLQAEALEQVVNRRLVAQWLAAEGYASTPDQVDELLAELKQRLADQELSFADFLKRRKLTESLVRRRLSWDSAWSRFLNLQLTDEALEKYFADHRREFDGTQLRVSHILLKVENLADRAQTAAAVKQAERLRAEIAGKKLSFAAAAERRSAGPSRRQGGDLGFIPRHGEMAEAFARAAFTLQPGEISAPVITPFGVHLIQCTEVKPGERSWQDCRRELAEAWSREQFLKLAEAARKKTVVKYAGSMPHFQGDAHELVVPGPRK